MPRAPFAAQDLTELVAAVTPAVVGVGSHQPLQQPPSRYRGTGFVVGDGNYCATNAHVVSAENDIRALMPGLAIFVPNAGHPETRVAHVVLRDEDHDLVLLRFEGAPLPALELGGAGTVRPGLGIALTGFPLGPHIGLIPATHVGIVSAVGPIATPVADGKQLDARQIRLSREPFEIYQLDATAFPGNSGSPVYETAGGRVVGVVNKVFVGDVKEKAITAPSGITYAVPVAHLQALLRRAEGGERESEAAVKKR
ncbi:MAG: trypsin-like peptidase domain-containing protein [Gammaproteobacteria bacterium]|nr:trypsin-like peptidase domain-containing protein [Gammaproteobacteria bacterium]MBI5618887.1 trypsin-like peptidase domain-containing protein [Gammaproteobacteria bacterium]